MKASKSVEKWPADNFSCRKDTKKPANGKKITRKIRGGVTDTIVVSVRLYSFSVKAD
jgi:hypothetical protein